ALLRPGYPRVGVSAEAYGSGYGYSYPDSGGKITPREVWRVLKKRKWLIAVIAVVATTLVTIVSFQSKSVYQASTTIEIERENRTLVRQGDVVIQSDDGGDDAYFTTVNMKTKIRILQSRPLLEDVVATLHLDTNPKFLDVNGKKTLFEAVKTIASKLHGQQPVAPHASDAAPDVPTEPGVRSPEESARLAPYVSILSAHLSAEPIEDTRMLVVSFSHSDPDLAASIVNTTAQLFIDRTFQNSTESFTKTSKWLDMMTRDLESKVKKAEEDVAQYTGQHNIFAPDGKQTLISDKLSRLFDQATRAESDRILKQSLYEEVKAGHLDQLPEAFADPKTMALRAKEGDLSVQLAQLNVKYGPDNPKIDEIKQQLAVIDQQITAGRGDLEARLKADYERAVRDEQTLNAALDRAKAESVQQNQAEIQFNILKQNVETQKQIYTDFLQKQSQAKVQAAEQHNNMRVIEPANAPVVPVGPDRLRSVMMGLVLSLFAGFGIAFGLEYVDNTIKTVDDVNRYAQLPALGVIPAITSRLPRRLLKGKSKDKQTLPSTGWTNLTPETPDRPVQLVALDSRSTAAEAYRGLRTSVLLSAAGGPPKTVMFTSGQPGEGKTTTSVNTAISLAQLGARVLLIDCDLRKPNTHKVFGVKHTRGLSTYLSGDHVQIEEVTTQLPIPNLSLISSGPIPPNPAELISSEKMRNLLGMLAQRYDHILIDSPPLMHVTDPVILSTMVDGVILVIHGGKSTRDVVRRARQELASVGAKVFGVVLNNLDLKREGYDDYYYYNYYSEGYGTDAR
ncbi:MAG TPA: polysaccharide biosynthesis tyrosine autokinase, partial [Blastocatellia bacterium]|nr:polysaccharide biosynthesis tyrosine autokinase [Blastocatellia bacterium]